MNIINLFEKHVKNRPDRAAIADKNSSYTFSQVKEKAERLARLIHKTGNFNKPVGVIVDRDADTILMFFGALYSGNFFVPLDGEFPAEKLGAIIRDTGADVVLGRKSDKGLVDEAGFAGHFFTPEDVGDETFRIDDGLIDEDSPAYILYTSGSTGKPKGILRSHANMVGRDFYFECVDIGVDDIVGNQRPFYYSAFYEDFSMFLTRGAKLEILPKELFSFPYALMEYLNEKKVTTIYWVPSALSQVVRLNTFSEIKPAYLKNVLFVGEVMHAKQLNKWIEALPDVRYIQIYGSAEEGPVCWYNIDGKAEEGKNLPIGGAFSCCDVFLLDENGNIVTEKNTPGEICASSPVLSVCYWNQPEMTSEKFVDMKVPGGQVKKVYKSGDMAYFGDDGNLVFAARRDFQIKLMGRRIELGEIETAMMTLPRLESTVCLFNEEKKVITRFCQVTPGSDITDREISDLLKKKLPEYMIPRKIVIMDRLPLNANGKIDRGQLKKYL